MDAVGDLVVCAFGAVAAALAAVAVARAINEAATRANERAFNICAHLVQCAADEGEKVELLRTRVRLLIRHRLEEPVWDSVISCLRCAGCVCKVNKQWKLMKNPVQ
jgi:hypothetical protein